MRDYVTLFAFDADGPYYTAGIYSVGHAEAAIDKAKAVLVQRVDLDTLPSVFVAVPVRNWTANEFTSEMVTRRTVVDAPADDAGIRELRKLAASGATETGSAEGAPVTEVPA